MTFSVELRHLEKFAVGSFESGHASGRDIPRLKDPQVFYSGAHIMDSKKNYWNLLTRIYFEFTTVLKRKYLARNL